MPHQILLLAAISYDWFMIIPALVILVVIRGYVRSKEQERKTKEVERWATDKPFRNFAFQFIIGIIVVVCFWAYKAFKGH